LHNVTIIEYTYSKYVFLVDIYGHDALATPLHGGRVSGGGRSPSSVGLTSSEAGISFQRKTRPAHVRLGVLPRDGGRVGESEK